MNKPVTLVCSVWFWTELFLTSTLLFPVAFAIWIVTLPFDPNQKTLHLFSCLWSDLVLFLNPVWSVRVTGREKIGPGKAYVIVSNHQSGADILVIFKLMVHFKWVSKWSLFWFPFIGWNMAMNRYIALKRGRKSSINRMVERCIGAVRRGNSVMIFPEGTRSGDGSVQAFKTGAFRIAIETQAPVLPIVISGTSRAVAKGGLQIHKNHGMQVVVLDPIPPEQYAGEDSKSLAARVEGIIRSGLASCTANPVQTRSSRPV